MGALYSILSRERERKQSHLSPEGKGQYGKWVHFESHE